MTYLLDFYGNGNFSKPFQTCALENDEFLNYLADVPKNAGFLTEGSDKKRGTILSVIDAGFRVVYERMEKEK